MASSIPIHAIHAYHFKERQLFSRMVFVLGMEPNVSMEIIAFWLWLEENGRNNLIRSINSLDDVSLLDVVSVGKAFVESLHLGSLSGNPRSFIEDEANQQFRRAAVSGINYYLSSVCYKALADISKNVDAEFILRMQRVVREMSQVQLDDCMSDNSYLQRIKPFTSTKIYPPLWEETSSGDGRTRDDNLCLHNKWFNINVPENGYETHQVLRDSCRSTRSVTPHVFDVLQSHTNQGIRIVADNLLLCEDSMPRYSPKEHASSSNHSTCSNIPHDERTLFVTFSNGYPLTEEELRAFFIRHYGDVEMVSVQEPVDGKPPLYGHVTFYSLATLLRVLNGNVKVKFMTQGKHLWVRRFIPKKKKNQG
ncbi:uncharacterized protein LOC135598245 [Musa acuminata AAA Group]|uniref:uncharacterized protein LOC135598245 n=1 Tax=Musa acuminata AAA Group TaxID=214697 RepID=UPI0031D5D203